MFSVAGGFCTADGKWGCTRSCLQMKALRGLNLGAFLCTCVSKPSAGDNVKASASLCTGLYSRTFLREGKQSVWNLQCSSSSLVLVSPAKQESIQAWVTICILMLTHITSQCQQKRRRNVLEVMHWSILGGWQVAGWDSSS